MFLCPSTSVDEKYLASAMIVLKIINSRSLPLTNHKIVSSVNHIQQIMTALIAATVNACQYSYLNNLLEGMIEKIFNIQLSQSVCRGFIDRF